MSGQLFFDKFIFPKRDRRDHETDEYARSESPWAVIGGVMKYFRMSYEEVVFRRSYLNIMLLNASIPGWKPMQDEEENNPEWDGIEKGKMHANEFFGGLM